jgi:hypothetical protein
MLVIVIAIIISRRRKAAAAGAAAGMAAGLPMVANNAAFNAGHHGAQRQHPHQQAELNSPYAAAPPDPTAEAAVYADPEQANAADDDDDDDDDDYMEPSKSQPALYDTNDVPGARDHERNMVPVEIRDMQLNAPHYQVLDGGASNNGVDAAEYEDLDANDDQPAAASTSRCSYVQSGGNRLQCQAASVGGTVKLCAGHACPTPTCSNSKSSQAARCNNCSNGKAAGGSGGGGGRRLSARFDGGGKGSSSNA